MDRLEPAANKDPKEIPESTPAKPEEMYTDPALPVTWTEEELEKLQRSEKTKD